MFLSVSSIRRSYDWAQPIDIETARLAPARTFRTLFIVDPAMFVSIHSRPRGRESSNFNGGGRDVKESVPRPAR